MLTNKNLRKSTYSVNNSCVIYKTKEEYGDLSNMAGGYPLVINDTVIKNSEALFQVCRYPHSPQIQQEILDKASPIIAKRVSKKYRDETREDWEDIKIKLMRWCLKVKSAQHYDKIKSILDLTKSKSIVEKHWRKDYWGTVTDKSDPTKLVGHNVLGKLWMEIREDFKKKSKKQLLAVKALDIDDFLFMGKSIENIK